MRYRRRSEDLLDLIAQVVEGGARNGRELVRQRLIQDHVQARLGRRQLHNSLLAHSEEGLLVFLIGNGLLLPLFLILLLLLLRLLLARLAEDEQYKREVQSGRLLYTKR